MPARPHHRHRRRFSALALLAPIALPLGAAAPEPVQSYDSYKSWFVACDNTLHCVAKGFADLGDRAEIRIDREAGPGGGIVASISADHGFALAAITIDGKAAGLAGPAWRIATSDDLTTATSADLGAIRAFVGRLRDGSRVTLGGETAVPLDGFAAAMLRLDERQGRLAGVTALIRTGTKPAAAVPAAPPVPWIAAHVVGVALRKGEADRLIAGVQAGQRALLAKEDCNVDPTTMRPTAHALDATRALVMIPCLMGAYQGSSLAFIAPRGGGGGVRRLIAPMPYRGNDPDRADASLFTEADFDEKTGTLSMSAKGRGLADCGVAASWIWQDGDFRLSDLSLQQACGGAEPGDWPVLFRSRR